MASPPRHPAIADTLLLWYDSAARSLPWRIAPVDRLAGVMPDPYRVWLSEIMLQQTTVAAVTGYFNRFTTRWPDVFALAAAEDDAVMAEWAGLGYYARARNLLACARIIAASGGQFPEDEASLQKLPGIGPYTAAAIAAIAFDRPAVVMDGNVERVMARLHAVETPLPAAKPELKAHAAAATPCHRPGDHAQAVMDLGATICTPRAPSCMICPLHALCAARRADRATDFPVKAPRIAKPTRYGHAYLLRDGDGAIWLERRPDRGLLGGMMGFPGTDWRETPPDPAPPLAAPWIRVDAPVRHVFTHFRLELTVWAAQLNAQTAAPIGRFVPAAEFAISGLPTVMRKVFRAGHDALTETVS